MEFCFADKQLCFSPPGLRVTSVTVVCFANWARKSLQTEKQVHRWLFQGQSKNVEATKSNPLPQE